MDGFDKVLAEMTKGRKLLPYQAVPEPETGWNNEYVLILVRHEVASPLPFVKIWRHAQTHLFRYSFSDIFVSNTMFDDIEKAKEELDEFLEDCGAILLSERFVAMV